MEILIYISGLLTTLIATLIVVANKFNIKYTKLLASNQSISNITSIRYEEMREKTEDLRILISDIQNTMEKDQYESLSGINKDLKDIGEIAMANNKRIGDNAKVTERNISDLLQQVTLMKGNIKALGQDPNSLSRY
tara:strand:- start:1692 stop:2099 length:408 start_codon:yes stop_codon:yes gene_type:complete